MLFKNYNKIIENGQTPLLQKKRKDVIDILSAALESVDPYKSVKRLFKDNTINFNNKIFDLSLYDNIYLVGCGKASIGMAKAVCESISIKKGVVVSNWLSLDQINESIEVIIGEHPIPSYGSLKGAEKTIDLLKQTKKNDLVVILISGGGSALLCKPRISLDDLKSTTDLLLKSGANINEINTIRKHLSYVKGRQLTKFTDSSIISLIISDIVDDPIEFIASGPTYPDSTTFLDAKQVLEKYNLIEQIPNSVLNIIDDGIKGSIPETPKRGDPLFERVNNFIIANIKNACYKATKKAKDLGYYPILFSTSITGEAREIATILLNNLKEYKKSNIAFISGGEPTVTIKGKGLGGRNQELVLAGIKNISDSEIVLASFATDGIDGKSDVAGAIGDGFTYLRAEKKKLDPEYYLNMNDSYGFFKQLNDVLITGPTGTNVMDIQIILN